MPGQLKLTQACQSTDTLIVDRPPLTHQASARISSGLKSAVLFLPNVFMNQSYRRAPRKLITKSIFVGLLWLTPTLVSCGRIPSVEVAPASPTSIPAETPSPSTSPTPEFTLAVRDIHWFRSSNLVPWELVGIVENLEAFPVENVELILSAPQLENPPAFPHTLKTIPAVIQPSSQAMFHTTLADIQSEVEFSFSYSAQRADARPPTPVRVEVLESRQLTDGRLEILGEVENQGDHLLHLYELQLLFYDQGGIPLGVATSEHVLPSLAPQSSNPFSASLDTPINFDSWEAFVDIAPELLPPSSPLILTDTFTTEQTHQGGIFFMGEVENKGVTPWWLVLDLIYSLEGDLLGLDTINLPFPILPQERIPFVIDPAQALPYELLDSIPGDQLDIQITVDPWKTLPTVDPWVSLPVTITQIEQIGSRVYLRGKFENSFELPISNPAVFIQILDVFGKTRASGWTDPLAMLEPGADQTFDLNLLIPEDLNFNLAEFDIRSFGLLATRD